jgi:hypothetical protein
VAALVADRRVDDAGHPAELVALAPDVTINALFDPRANAVTSRSISCLQPTTLRPGGEPEMADSSPDKAN